MATMAELSEQNASFEEQMNTWRQQRFANGENPMDWTAFRQHMQAIGAPDPGETAPDEFSRWDETMHGGTSEQTSATTPTGAV